MLLYKPEPKYKKSPVKEEKFGHHKEKSDNGFKNTIEEEQGYEEETDSKRGSYRRGRRQQRIVYRAKNTGD